MLSEVARRRLDRLERALLPKIEIADCESSDFQKLDVNFPTALACEN